MKQKVLELSFDDETGKFTLVSDFNPIAGITPDSGWKELMKYSDILDSLVAAIFEENSKGMSISQIIKTLTMADVAADVQPYEHIEQLWSTMMFSFLPNKEKQYRKMKEAHGVHTKVVEPISMSPLASCFPMSFIKS